MIVISPSFTILHELDQQSLAVRIERCGRLCYKSEDMITEDSAPVFIRKILKHGHNSVAEMAVLTLKVILENDDDALGLYKVMPRYLYIDKTADYLFISGSVRAFRELYLFNPEVKIVRGLAAFLYDRHPLFFEDLAPGDGIVPEKGIKVEKIALAEVEKFAPDLLANHRFVAVKFIVNRAVTHEMVRHRPCGFLQESQRYCRYSDSKFGNQVTFIKPLFYDKGSPQYLLWQKAMADTEKIYLDLLETSTPQAARTVLPNSCKTELIVYANLKQWHHMFRLRTSKGADPSMREVMIPLLRDFQQLFPASFSDIVAADS